VPSTETVPSTRPWPPVWRGLFVGEETWHDRFPFCIGPQQALLVLGPPRSGKTTSVVVPNVLIGPGAVVTTSTKTDVVAWTAALRAKRGRTWLFDPSGTIGPKGLTPLRWSPVTGCEDWAVANDRAHALASASRSGGGSYLSDHWSERAEALLAPLLHAAALGGKTMASVLRWVLRKDVDEAVDLATGADGHFLAADTIEGVLGTDARERSGIFSTAANLLAAYRNPAALEATMEPNFDPEAFVRSSDTVYICAPAAEQDLLAPIVIAFWTWCAGSPTCGRWGARRCCSCSTRSPTSPRCPSCPPLFPRAEAKVWKLWHAYRTSPRPEPVGARRRTGC
jgi:type IV secretory pathway TraG/TraD family ATPase VirD4